MLIFADLVQPACANIKSFIFWDIKKVLNSLHWILIKLIIFKISFQSLTKIQGVKHEKLF